MVSAKDGIERRRTRRVIKRRMVNIKKIDEWLSIQRGPKGLSKRFKAPKIRIQCGKLLLIHPFGSKPGLLLGKHKSWMSTKTGFIRECLKEAPRKKVVE